MEVYRKVLLALRTLPFASRRSDETLRRFARLVFIRGECWEWQGYRDPNGYGQFTVNRTDRPRAHRFVAQVAYGDVSRRVVMHLCDNPPCVNPEHLRPGTQAENLADMDAKGRRSKHRAKLTAHDVARIKARLADGETHAAIAADYPVARTVVTRINTGELWPEVERTALTAPLFIDEPRRAPMQSGLRWDDPTSEVG